MDISDEDMAAVGEAAHAVIREAKDAGFYVFGGGINEDVAPLMVAADGTVTNVTYPQTKEFDGGFCVLELPSREAAVQWAAKIAKACRCSQELREFGYDPESWPARSQPDANEEVLVHLLSSLQNFGQATRPSDNAALIPLAIGGLQTHVVLPIRPVDPDKGSIGLIGR
jgi:hypothetical protein